MISQKRIIHLIFIFLIIILIYNHFFLDPLAKPSKIISELTNIQEEILTNLKEMSKLLISLSTALFGLIGYFAFESYKSKNRVDNSIRIHVVLAFSFAALSIDFGYIAMDKWIEMLSIPMFNPYDRLVEIPRLLQLFTFLLSLLFTGSLVYKILLSPSQNAEE